jgi:hypothetical protein
VTSSNDPNASNNTSATVTTNVTCLSADFAITKTASNTTVPKGTPIYYTLTATNNGPSAVPATISDTFPANVTFASAPGCTYTSTAVSCPTGVLASGQSKSFLVKFATTNTPCNAVISNTATVTSSNDPNASNNTSATVTTNVTCSTVAAPGLVITSKATASSDTVVSNQKNVSLLRFEARGQNADILLTNIVGEASGCSLMNGQNYALWVDTDANGIVDTILQKGVSPVNGKVSFSNLAGSGYVAPTNQSVIFEIHADISSSLTSNLLQLRLATSQSNYIAAKLVSDGSNLSGIKTDGTCVSTCAITVTTVPSTLYTIRSQGDLYITKSSTPVRSRQLLGGTLSDEILRLEFHAEYEDIDVTNLVFTVDGTDAASFSTNVDRLELYKVGSVTPFATATMAACGTDLVPANSMCARMVNQEFLIPKGSNTNILVRARMRTDVDGAVSGKHVVLRVDAVQGAKARGLLSSNNLLQNDGDALSEGEVFIGTSSPSPSQTILGNNNVVVLSKVTSITNVDPNANGTAIPTGVQRQIGQFKFSTSAASNTRNGQNKFTLSDIIFHVNSLNVDLDGGSFKFYNKADASSKAPCTVSQTSGSASLVVTCSGLTTTVNTEIDPGTDTTFVLQADVQNGKVSNSQTSMLQVSLQNFGNMSASSFDASGSHLRWLDKDFGSSTSFLWIEYPETVINGTVYQG